jgi:hypothetical protein
MSALDSFPSKDKQDKPLSKEEAQQEAGMVRAELKVSPEFGDIFDPYRDVFDPQSEAKKEGEPTAEDYDAALAAIEELKETAQNEPTMKAVDVLARLAERSKYAALMVLSTFSHVGIIAQPAIEMQHERAMSRLDSASTKLLKLKEKAERYDRPEDEDAVKIEQATLQDEIDSARSYADDLERRIDTLAEARASFQTIAEYRKGIQSKGVEEQKEDLRNEIESWRKGAEDKEKRFNEIARGRASYGYTKRQNS